MDKNCPFPPSGEAKKGGLLRQAHHPLRNPERSRGTGREAEEFTPLASSQVPGLCIRIELELHWHEKPICHSIH
jgi:hypothetical protein